MIVVLQLRFYRLSVLTTRSAYDGEAEGGTISKWTTDQPARAELARRAGAEVEQAIGSLAKGVKDRKCQASRLRGLVQLSGKISLLYSASRRPWQPSPYPINHWIWAAVAAVSLTPGLHNTASVTIKLSNSLSKTTAHIQTSPTILPNFSIALS
jgi:hypothetical protein